MEQIDFSSMTKEELEKYALDTSRKLDEVSNNRGERAIKPFVMGRKNWLFCNTPRGAKASAILYSIVVSAVENGLNLYERRRSLPLYYIAVM